MTTLEANAFGSAAVRSLGYWPLLSHVAGAMPAFFAMAKKRLCMRKRLPVGHTLDPEMIGREQATFFNQVVKGLLGVLAYLRTISAYVNRHAKRIVPHCLNG
jgi:hypothetical protein